VNRAGPARTPGMGLLRSIETGIERVVDGTVGRVVRVSVQPVEIARKLAKELEDGKQQSGGRTFVPSQYTVYLPPKDRERFSEYEASLRVELGAYLAEHVRREGYSVLARPRVTFETAEELASGTFGIATEREAPPEEAAVAPFEAPPRRVQAEPIPTAPSIDLPQLPLDLPETPMFGPPPVPVEPIVSEPDPEPDADWPVEAPEPVSPFEPDPEPEAEVEPVFEAAAEPLPAEAEEAPAPAEPAPTPPSLPGPGLSGPVHAPAPFLPVPAPPVPAPPLPTPAIPEAEPEPVAEPVGATQSVSASDAARAGLAHASDALVVAGRRYTLTGPLTVIGRSSACDVALDDASASRRHAELRRRGGKTVLVDLDSTNGTLVNGRRVREAPLRAGDRITIGTTTIVFERAS
jgi:Protein of unknown function (DUF3662)/FHA domain